jgi:eukaryotic-like serine/threonine-protein kinase
MFVAYYHHYQLSNILIFASMIIILVWLPSSFGIGQQITTTVATTVQTTEPDFVPYSNPTFGIRTEYPADWGRLDLSFLLNNSADIDFYPLDDTSGSKHIRMQVETLLSAHNMTLEQYNNARINSTEGQILGSNSTVLSGLPAREIVFTSTDLKTMQVWTVKDGRVYTISYIAPEEDFQNDLLIAKRMIESFQINE